MIVFTNGCFDIYHAGHASTFKQCRQLAGKDGKVIVGLNSDSSVKRIKGHWRPVTPQDERWEVLNSIEYIDKIIIFSDDTPEQLIKDIKPDIIVKGEDWKDKYVVGSDIAMVEFVPYEFNQSTSKIIDKCVQVAYEEMNHQMEQEEKGHGTD